MDLPPQRNYGTKEALFASINAWAGARGYSFVSRRSTKEKSGKSTITYACDRSWTVPTREDCQRNTISRGTGCHFSVIAKEASNGSWDLKYRPNPEFSVHNHEPRYPLRTPGEEHQPPEEASQQENISNSGDALRDIQALMRRGELLATEQATCNQMANGSQNVHQSQTPIYALANQLDMEGFWSRVRFAPDGRITALLFAHPDALNSLKAHPDVLLLNTTYKANKYGMPLLNMIGMDARGRRSFCIAFAFLNGETETDYSWALVRLKSLYKQCDTTFPSTVFTDKCPSCITAASIHFSSSTLICNP